MEGFINKDLLGVIMIHNLIEWNPWWEGKNFTALTGFARQKTKDILSKIELNLIQTVLGVRRCGKSTILYQIITELLNKGTNSREILLINLEDDILSATELDKIIEVYIEHVKPEKLGYLFVDEIQNREKWEFWIKKQHDLKKFKAIFVSGSSSLSSTYSTLLTGRQLLWVIEPLNFNEFLQFKKFNVPKIIGMETKARIKGMLNEYIHYGGFPQVALSEDKHAILVSYYTTIEEKDIIMKQNLDAQKVKMLLRFLLTNIARLHSHKKLASIINCSTTTIGSYMTAFENAFLIFQVPIFSYKVKDQLRYPRKIYCIDTGLRNVASFLISADKGWLYENIVAVNLRKNNEVYYWKNIKQQEIDFVVKNNLKVVQLVQVCSDIENPEVKKREISAMLMASKELRCNNLLIITDDYEGKETIEKKDVHYVPLWKWLLADGP